MRTHSAGNTREVIMLTTRTIMYAIIVVILIAMTGTTWAADADTSDVTPEIKEDAKTGQKVPQTAAQVQQNLEAAAQRIDALSQTVATGLQDGSIVKKLAEDNARLRDGVNQTRQANGGNQYLGASIPLPGGFATIGGPVIELEKPTEWIGVPETVNFIVEGRNRLGSLDNKMKRGANWLNKHTCGGFDWGANFSSMFRVDLLKEYLTNLGEGVIAAAPMALLCSFAPTICEVVKTLKLNVGFQLSAEKMTCQQIEAAMTKGVSNELWQSRYRRCLAERDLAGDSIEKVNAECQQILKGEVKDSQGNPVPINVSQAAAQANNSWLASGYDWTMSTLQQAGSAVDNGAASMMNASNQGGNEGELERGAAQAAGGGMAGSVKNIMSGFPGSGLLQTAGGLFGNVRFAGSGGLELGRKRFQLFEIQMENRASVVRDDLAQSLSALGGELLSAIPDINIIQDTHGEISAWTTHMRGGEGGAMPWTDPKYGSSKFRTHMGTHGNDYRFDNSTVDKLSVLFVQASVVQGMASDLQRDKGWIEKKYHPIHFTNMLARYELWLYMSIELHNVHQMLTQANSALPSTSEEVATKVQKAQAQYDRAIEEVETAIAKIENELVPILPIINSYVLPNKGVQPGGNQRPTGGGFPAPAEDVR